MVSSMPATGGADGGHGDSAPRAEGTDSAISKDTSPGSTLPPGWRSTVPVVGGGWGSEKTPLCQLQQGWGIGGTDGLFADGRGVFVLGWDDCAYIDRDFTGCPNDGSGHMFERLRLHDGSGWRIVAEASSFFNMDLAGMPGGPIFLQGDICGLAQVDLITGQQECALPPSLAWNNSINPTIFGVKANLAYVTTADKLVELRDGQWTTLAASLPDTINAIWAVEGCVYLAGKYQIYVWRSTSPATIVPLGQPPAGEYVAAWGFAENDVWFGNTVGQLVHYDGNGFRILQITQSSHGGIRGLWGDAGILYFHSDLELGRFRSDGQTEILLSGTPAQDSSPVVQALWGRSANEVFLSLSGIIDGPIEPCQINTLYWFDGESLHPF
jgi:hypothetical protein